jgi:tRNA(Arg) A34 adenosine deaminase TadA
MILARDTRHLQRALKVAAQSTYRWRHGAVIARGNRVLAVHPNSARNATHNVAYAYGAVTTHAEYAAIKGR